jgi:tetratricopeptide (TPR) repeat protein
MIVRLSMLLFLLSGVVRAQSLVGMLPYDLEREQPAAGLLDVPALLQGMSNITQRAELGFSTPLVPADSAQDEWSNRLREAQGWMSSNRFETAANVFSAYLQENPANLLVRVVLADCLYSLGQFGAAEANYLHVLEKEPNHFLATNNLAWLYSTATDPLYRKGDKAVALAKKSVVRAPGSYHVWSTLSESLYVSGRYKEAMDAASEALQRAQRQQAKDILLATYLNQVEKCRAAWLATSILE